MNRRKSQQGVQSIEIGGRLLRALAEAPRAQMLRDLAAAAQMPAAKAHRYLVSFARMGLVEQQEDTGLYDLGSFALELGLGALARLEPVTIAAPALRELADETGQTVAIAVWANRGATMVRWLGTDTPVAASLRLGSVMPLTRSATGRVFLANLPSQSTSAWVRKELAENSRNGLQPSTAKEVDRLILETRRLGYAWVSDFIPGISGIAAPVFDHSGAMALALVALGYARPFDKAGKTVAEAVTARAAALCARFGFRAA